MHVLIVEDETRLAALVADGLGRVGITSEIVNDGRSGLEVGSSERFDVIVLDILLPEMNGFVVCRELRAAGVATPILMLTAKEGDLDESEALDIGADDYLRKPFSFDVLASRLRALVRRTGRAADRILLVGTLRIETDSHGVRRGEHEVELTPREHAVLVALASRAGRIVPKQTIYDEAWGHETDHRSNVVEVYIRYLRSKLDEPFGVRTIETVRGAGYRLSVDPMVHEPSAPAR
ncbi:MAG: response regulator transcription factor [Actinomycetota bacterium]